MGKKILDTASYTLMWKPWYKKTSIGLSWFLGGYKREVAVRHEGGDTGFNTNLILLPEKSMAVVVLCNLNGVPVERIGTAALDILLGGEPATYKKPAILPVYKEFENNGPDAAVKMWNSLVSDHAEEYDFNAQFLTGLYNAVEADRPKEAAVLTELYANMLGEKFLNELKSSAEEFLKNSPKNTAIPAILKVIDEYLKK